MPTNAEASFLLVTYPSAELGGDNHMIERHPDQRGGICPFSNRPLGYTRGDDHLDSKSSNHEQNVMPTNMEASFFLTKDPSVTPGVTITWIVRHPDYEQNVIPVKDKFSTYKIIGFSLRQVFRINI